MKPTEDLPKSIKIFNNLCFLVIFFLCLTIEIFFNSTKVKFVYSNTIFEGLALLQKFKKFI